MNPKLLALYGLKYNPFSPELPFEALYVPPKIENFASRIEHTLVREGGFALIAPAIPELDENLFPNLFGAIPSAPSKRVGSSLIIQ